MKQIKFQTGMIFVILLFTIITVGCSASSQGVPSPTEDLVVPTETASADLTATPSPLPPTETPTVLPPTPTETATLVPTEAPTDTPPPTATAVPPLAVANQDAGCRTGPGTSYRILAFVSAGDTGIVDGRTEDSSWLRIQLPDVEEACWVFSDFVSQDSDPTLIAVITPAPLPTDEAPPTEEPSGPKYFLLIPNNGGPFACGDGLVYYYARSKGQSLEDNIRIALNALFSVKSEYVGDYYNSVYKSSLQVKKVEIVNGRPTIWLKGKFVKPKDSCDSKRMHVQVWETASQFGGVTQRPVIWVNNVLLGDLLEGTQK